MYKNNNKKNNNYNRNNNFNKPKTKKVTLKGKNGRSIIFEVDGVSKEIAQEALRLAAQKLPITTKFIVRPDYDPTQNV